MLDYEVFRAELGAYVIAMLIVAGAVLAAGNVLLLLLKLTKVFSERKVWILGNLVGLAILLANIAPVCLDIAQASYREIPNVVKIERHNSKYDDQLLLTDSSGQVYTCRDDLVDESVLENPEYPVVAIYAQHSKLLLGVYSADQPSE